jgi:6-pyruvoyltetrahydropterin/6-carboxytetrahydropterin synthase
MLIDFGLLKTALRETVALLDHTNLNDRPEFDNDPSAERIARFIFDAVHAKLAAPAGGADPRLLHAVDVYETPTSMARFSR